MTEGSSKGLLKPDVVGHTFNPSTGKQAAGSLVIFRLARAT